MSEPVSCQFAIEIRCIEAGFYGNHFWFSGMTKASKKNKKKKKKSHFLFCCRWPFISRLSCIPWLKKGLDTEMLHSQDGPTLSTPKPRLSSLRLSQIEQTHCFPKTWNRRWAHKKSLTAANLRLSFYLFISTVDIRCLTDNCSDIGWPLLSRIARSTSRLRSPSPPLIGCPKPPNLRFLHRKDCHD